MELRLTDTKWTNHPDGSFDYEKNYTVIDYEPPLPYVVGDPLIENGIVIGRLATYCLHGVYSLVTDYSITKLVLIYKSLPESRPISWSHWTNQDLITTNFEDYFVPEEPTTTDKLKELLGGSTDGAAQFDGEGKFVLKKFINLVNN